MDSHEKEFIIQGIERGAPFYARSDVSHVTIGRLSAPASKISPLADDSPPGAIFNEPDCLR